MGNGIHSDSLLEYFIGIFVHLPDFLSLSSLTGKVPAFLCKCQNLLCLLVIQDYYKCQTSMRDSVIVRQEPLCTADGVVA